MMYHKIYGNALRRMGAVGTLAPCPKFVKFFVGVRNLETDVSTQNIGQGDSKSILISKIARKLGPPDAPNEFGAGASARDAMVPLFDIQTKFADQI